MQTIFSLQSFLCFNFFNMEGRQRDPYTRSLVTVVIFSFQHDDEQNEQHEDKFKVAKSPKEAHARPPPHFGYFNICSCKFKWLNICPSWNAMSFHTQRPRHMPGVHRVDKVPGNTQSTRSSTRWMSPGRPNAGMVQPRKPLVC